MSPNVVQMTTRGTRPARAEIDAAALELLRRQGAQILATARRYAATPEDAEDAYQRGIEILLTKAPSTREQELIPWLKTVVIRTLDRRVYPRSTASRYFWLASDRRRRSWPSRS